MRLFRMLGGLGAILALTACAALNLPDALDTTAEVVATMDCATAASTLEQGEAVLALYAEVEDSIIVAAPVLDRLGVELAGLDREANIARVQAAVDLLEVRVAACA